MTKGCSECQWVRFRAKTPAIAGLLRFLGIKQQSKVGFRIGFYWTLVLPPAMQTISLEGLTSRSFGVDFEIADVQSTTIVTCLGLHYKNITGHLPQVYDSLKLTRLSSR
jgi:hypothetical protein